MFRELKYRLVDDFCIDYLIAIPPSSYFLATSDCGRTSRSGVSGKHLLDSAHTLGNPPLLTLDLFQYFSEKTGHNRHSSEKTGNHIWSHIKLDIIQNSTQTLRTCQILKDKVHAICKWLSACVQNSLNFCKIMYTSNPVKNSLNAASSVACGGEGLKPGGAVVPPVPMPPPWRLPWLIFFERQKFAKTKNGGLSRKRLIILLFYER